MARVVRPGGRVLVLEFGQPEGFFFGPLFRWYSRIIMPRIGGLLTGSADAYEYLPRTSSNFPAGENFVTAVFEPAGVRLLRAQPLTFGIAWLYLGEVPQA
jgi:demethylmenaquinone methyltransferase/2-methoxy-6-polyprenyl-1,4-benzoquinol methylase